MKLLMIYADLFGYKTNRKGWQDAPDIDEEKRLKMR